jgi:multisubunit Na+/H+ antiporter MnhB subunit
MTSRSMSGWLHVVVALVLLPLAGLLITALVSLPPEASGLSDRVAGEMPSSGVLHPLTAVLLNFRGYDTLLEIGVLLVAVMAVWSLDQDPPRQFRWHASPHQNSVLRVGLGMMIPVMVVAAGYMIWVGAYRPGGAFQSGAILGSAAVTLISAGLVNAPLARSVGIRIFLSAGFIFFIGVAFATVMVKGHLLGYPIEWSGRLILMIESVLAVSIGAALAGLFAGVAGTSEDSP